MRKESTDSKTKMTQMLELSDKDFEAAIIKIFLQQL